MSDAFDGAQAGNQITPAYAYIVRLLDVGEVLFLTGYTRPVFIAELPAKWDAADPQEFACSQISHGEHGLSAEYDGKPLTVNLTTQTTALAQYFATASATRIEVAIFRLNSGKLLTGEALQYDVDAVLLNTGFLGKIAFNGQNVSAEIMPLPYGANQTVPRVYYQRKCGHVLGDPNTCKADLSTFTHVATIDEMQQSNRMLTLNITAPGGDAGYFRGGVFIHTPTGQLAGIDACDADGPGGKIRLRLKVWNMAFTPGDGVTVRAGCSHLVEECVAKFDNRDNFGGFAYVPNRNPAMHGMGL